MTNGQIRKNTTDVTDSIEKLVGTLSEDAKKQVEALIDQVAENARDAYERTAAVAGRAASQGEDLLNQARDQGERLYQDPQGEIKRHVRQEPVVSLLIAGAIGFGIACMLMPPRR